MVIRGIQVRAAVVVAAMLTLGVGGAAQADQSGNTHNTPEVAHESAQSGTEATTEESPTLTAPAPEDSSAEKTSLMPPRTVENDTITPDQICGEYLSPDGVFSIDLSTLVPSVPGATLKIGGGTTLTCINQIAQVSITRDGEGGYENLEITAYTFLESEQATANPLVSVEFPEELKTLRIGANAFHQSDGVGGSSLESVTFSASLQELEIGGAAFSQVAKGNNALRSVVFPQGLETLKISRNAFDQSADGGGNALESVTFPESLRVLEIGAAAFSQEATGSNALKSVTFPQGLETLKISRNAFDQSAEVGDNALESVTFPVGLRTLEIGPSAFYQSSSAGGSNALKSVVFPEGLKTLDIGWQAFLQSSPNASALKSVVFPEGLEKLTIADRAFSLSASPNDLMLFFSFDSSGIPNEVSLGVDITTRTENARAVWVWLGQKGTTADEWGIPDSYLLQEALTATFNPNGGNVPSNYSNRQVVFPAVDGQPQVAALADVTDLDPAGYRSTPLEYRMSLPEANPAAEWGGAASLTGWCGTAWAGGDCETESAAPGSQVILSPDSRSHTFAAGWTASPAVPTITAPTCGVAPEVTVPSAVEGLYEYEKTSEGATVTVTAKPAPYVSLTESAWTFQTAFTISFALDGGEGEFPPITVQGEGCSVTLPSGVPSKAGFTFKGWKLQGSDATGLLSPGAIYTVSGDATLTAQWEKTAPVTPPGIDKPAKTVTTQLSNTGGSLLPYGIGALVLLAAGGAILVLRKRQR